MVAEIWQRWLNVVGFQQTSARFQHLSDAKIRGTSSIDSNHQQTSMSCSGRFSQTTYKNEEFKSKKLFTVFKTVNRFLKIKESFTIKLKNNFCWPLFLIALNIKKINTKNILCPNKRKGAKVRIFWEMKIIVWMRGNLILGWDFSMSCYRMFWIFQCQTSRIFENQNLRSE